MCSTGTAHGSHQAIYGAGSQGSAPRCHGLCKAVGGPMSVCCPAGGAHDGGMIMYVYNFDR
eukprot:scaffold107857_cov34-Prasinocladus_malaysianus.AAC.1